MTQALEDLIQSLREELQSYGEMLARLDQQQEQVMNRAPDELLQSTAGIETQTHAIQEARRARESKQGIVALGLKLASDAGFSEIIPNLPSDYRPLLSALVQENNELLVRVHQRSRQNHILLCRSVELMGRLLGSLLPGSSTVYTEKGDVLGAFGRITRSTYHAIG
jgi:hypothetical protein